MQVDLNKIPGSLKIFQISGPYVSLSFRFNGERSFLSIELWETSNR